MVVYDVAYCLCDVWFAAGLVWFNCFVGYFGVCCLFLFVLIGVVLFVSCSFVFRYLFGGYFLWVGHNSSGLSFFDLYGTIRLHSFIGLLVCTWDVGFSYAL